MLRELGSGVAGLFRVCWSVDCSCEFQFRVSALISSCKKGRSSSSNQFGERIRFNFGDRILTLVGCSRVSWSKNRDRSCQWILSPSPTAIIAERFLFLTTTAPTPDITRVQPRDHRDQRSGRFRATVTNEPVTLNEHLIHGDWTSLSFGCVYEASPVSSFIDVHRRMRCMEFVQFFPRKSTKPWFID